MRSHGLRNACTRSLALTLLAWGFTANPASAAAAAGDCAGLKGKAPPDAEITAATLQQAGPFVIPPEFGPARTVQRRRLLSGSRCAAAHTGLGHRFRGMAAGRRLERPLPGCRQRRICRLDRLWQPRHGGSGWICRGIDGHRPRTWTHGRQLGGRTPGEGRRFRLARRASDHRCRQVAHCCLLWGTAQPLLFQLMLERGPPGAHGGTALS